MKPALLSLDVISVSPSASACRRASAGVRAAAARCCASCMRPPASLSARATASAASSAVAKQPRCTFFWARLSSRPALNEPLGLRLTRLKPVLLLLDVFSVSPSASACRRASASVRAGPRCPSAAGAARAGGA